MKDGKRLITGTSKGEILTWNPQNFQFEGSCSVHRQRVQAIALSNWEKYVISGDKLGKIVYTNVKMK